MLLSVIKKLNNMGEINCENCAGACCTYLTQLRLSEPEVQFLTDSGTSLRMIIDQEHRCVDEYDNDHYRGLAEKLAPGIGLYGLLNDCVFLDSDKRCRIFGQPERPKICSDFQAGSDNCKKIRLTRGIWDFD